MALILGYEIPAGTTAWDETRGGGPQAEGLTVCKIVKVVEAKKTKVIQAEVHFEVQAPAHRAGESFRNWYNVIPLTNSPESLKGCREQVTLLLSSVGTIKDGVLPKTLTKGFDLGGHLTGKEGVPVYTRPGEGELQPQVALMTREMAAEVEAGTKVVPDTRRKKFSGGGRAGRAGTRAAGVSDDPFANNGGGDPFGGGGDAGDAGGDDPFAN